MKKADEKLIKKILNAVEERLREERAFGLKSLQENLMHQYRQKRAARSYHENLVKKAFDLAGIDQEIIKKRQQKADEANRKFKEKQERLVKEHSKLVEKRQRERIRKIIKYRHLFERKQSNPKGLWCLWFADSIIEDKFEVSIGDPHVDSPPPLKRRGALGENWVEYKCEIDTDGGDHYSEGYSFDFIFTADGPPSDGLASTTSWVQPNGAYSFFMDSGCFNDPYGEVLMIALLRIGQFNPQGEPESFSYYASDTFLHRVFEEPHGNYVITDAIIPFRDEVVLNLDPFPLIQDYPVVCTVTVKTMLLAGDGGEAMLDIRSDDYRVNVPSVWLVVDYV